jgi:GH35 family endo-1,4-beta-xylanase
LKNIGYSVNEDIQNKKKIMKVFGVEGSVSRDIIEFHRRECRKKLSQPSLLVTPDYILELKEKKHYVNIIKLLKKKLFKLY